MPDAPKMTPEVQAILRKPFLPAQVGKLPKITCRDCSRSREKSCERHQKQNCRVCNNWMSTAHIHVDYVGHAAVTARLLEADPDWSWVPAYRDVNPAVLAGAVASGNPEVVRMVMENSPPLQAIDGMWIALTICGVTRLGYGTDDRGGPDHDKILIGDAIRNAAMRFGVALDLWSKEDITPIEEPVGPLSLLVADSKGRNWIAEARACTTLEGLLELGRTCTEAGEMFGETRDAFVGLRRAFQEQLATTVDQPQQERNEAR